MNQKISVDKAINRGHLIINVPVMLIMFGIPGITLYLFSENLIPNWSLAISFFLGFGIAWVYWSFSVTKWRLWAFENVRNVHELKKKATESGLIWSDTKWFNKTEFKSQKDKLKWKELQKKFEKEDEYSEDRSLPQKTIVYFSKAKNTFELVIMLVCLGIGIFLVAERESYIIGTLLILVGGYLSIKELKQVLNSKPQIVLDNRGIKTSATEFKKWTEIKNEEVIMQGSGKTAEFYLVYDYLGGFEKLSIDDYNISPKKLENLLRTYRIRSNKNYR